MKKLAKIASIFFAVAMTLIGLATPANAWVSKDGQINNPKDPSTWCQYCTMYKSPVNYNDYQMGQGWNLGQSGCGQFSMTYVMRKAGVVDENYTVIDLYNANKNLSASQKTFSPNPQVHNISAVTGGKLTVESTLMNATFDQIKKAFNSGYYVIINWATGANQIMGGHLTAVDDVTDDDIILFDSAGPEAKPNGTQSWKNYYKLANDKNGTPLPNENMKIVWFIKPAEGVRKANEAPKLGSWSKSGGSENGDSKEAKDSGGVVPELELIGIPKIVNLNATADEVNMVNVGTLDFTSDHQLQDILDVRKKSKKLTPHG